VKLRRDGLKKCKNLALINQSGTAAPKKPYRPLTI